MFPIFRDRVHAGGLLAEALAGRSFENAVVLALPRGGVPVAMAVAEALHAPLDLILVRKLGAPTQPELAVGAVVDGAQPEIVLNDAIVAELGVSQAEINRIAAWELGVIAKRRQRWLSGRPPTSLAGCTALIVDDGIATGATVRAAVHAVRRQGAVKVIVATPVAPAEVVAGLAEIADDVVVLETPRPFHAIGRFYDDFSQLSDDDVTRMLADARHPPPVA